ncbi:periplasmic nitrate reductase, NapE protein [Parasedimentitalea psychrophila]|uniref:Periplasmic nitrate reductase, NapE protein n=1 Tax=Parasedimentitalea psychrophila TaxID=2997337 RepID=A0A9Y2L0S1_9RHOB|nr:periplasmic nitrate reductase, NapE protein [Parasedimentitalea psychrophila]WIY25566.1 periplasmic nitrate reductase, NapE protein [Parasedimentitalea psychrophila]
MVTDTIEAKVGIVSKSDERWAFLVLAVFLAPVLAGILVGGFGFSVWMLQLVFGPPTG